MPAETERVAQRAFHDALLRLEQRQVQDRHDLPIEKLPQDARGNHAVRNGEDAGQRLGGSGGTQQVSRHRLGGRDIDVVDVIAQPAGDCLKFGDFARVSRSTVNVH